MANIKRVGLEVFCEEPEGTWIYEPLPAIVNTNKPSILADGVDFAFVTAETPPELAEVTFFCVDTGQTITTVPVDPETRTATLQVTATTPGIIRIRAGEPTITRLNEVIIHAVEAD